MADEELRCAQLGHTLEGFLKDAVKLPGYLGEKMLGGRMVLDKDKLSEKSDLYSKANCCFISRVESNNYKPTQMKTFIATDPNGNVYEDFNQSSFARKHGLQQSTISACLKGVIVNHAGWSFKYK